MVTYGMVIILWYTVQHDMVRCGIVIQCGIVVFGGMIIMVNCGIVLW